MQPTKLYQLNAYKALDFFITHVDLEIDLTQQPELSKAKLTIMPNLNTEHLPDDLQLDTDLARLLNGKNLDKRAPRQNSYIAVPMKKGRIFSA